MFQIVCFLDRLIPGGEIILTEPPDITVQLYTTVKLQKVQTNK